MYNCMKSNKNRATVAYRPKVEVLCLSCLTSGYEMEIGGRIFEHILFTMTKNFHSARLETRTKESNMYASLRVQNSKAKRK